MSFKLIKKIIIKELLTKKKNFNHNIEFGENLVVTN